MGKYKTDISFVKPGIMGITLSLMVFVGGFIYCEIIEKNYSKLPALIIFLLFVGFVGFYYLKHYTKELCVEEGGLKITFLNSRICKYPWKKIWFSSFLTPYSIIIKWKSIVYINLKGEQRKHFIDEMRYYLKQKKK